MKTANSTIFHELGSAVAVMLHSQCLDWICDVVCSQQLAVAAVADQDALFWCMLSGSLSLVRVDETAQKRHR